MRTGRVAGGGPLPGGAQRGVEAEAEAPVAYVPRAWPDERAGEENEAGGFGGLGSAMITRAGREHSRLPAGGGGLRHRAPFHRAQLGRRRCNPRKQPLFKVQSGKMGPAPGRFELSKGMSK